MLDASALLAYLNGEPGGEKVPVNTGEARISAVNYSEAVAVLTRLGARTAEVRATLSSILLDVVEFDRDQAEAAGFMIATTRSLGLSLGDRACLAAARAQGIPAMTADRSWSDLGTGVSIQLIR
jgi:PIN domain nuclease of toxin-antitoxin system